MSASQHSKKRINILVIANDIILIRQLKRICSEKKFAIMSAQTIGHGFEKFEDHEIDILILTGSVARFGRVRGMAFLDNYFGKKRRNPNPTPGILERYVSCFFGLQEKVLPVRQVAYIRR